MFYLYSNNYSFDHSTILIKFPLKNFVVYLVVFTTLFMSIYILTSQRCLFISLRWGTCVKRKGT